MPVFTMENHDRAYRIWKQAGVKDKILVHVDAHLDFCWVADEDPVGLLNQDEFQGIDFARVRGRFWNISRRPLQELITIGNYIYPAIKEGMVREFYWVVPDPVWDRALERRQLKDIFSSLKRLNPRESGPVRIYPDRIEASLAGIKVTALKLSSLPRIEEDVLLDIDLDFLVIDSLKAAPPYFDSKKSLPWIWPQELAGSFKARNIKPGLITLAYSVEGGWTPLEYKFLGDELKVILQGGGPTEGFLILRRAIELQAQGELEEVRRQIEEGLLLADSTHKAALYYHLAKIFRERGALEGVKTCLSRAVAADVSYDTIYNNQALRLKEVKRFKQAIAECRFMLDIFPEGINYRLLLADALLESGRIEQALREYLEVLHKRPDNFAGLAASGSIYYKKRNYLRAIEFLRRALRTYDKDTRSHYWLGLAYAAEGNINQAVVCLQKSAVLGMRGPGVYLRLARLYVRKRNFYKAWEKFISALKAL